MTDDRLPPIPAAALTDDQIAASEAFMVSRGTAVFGPFVPLLRSPEMMLRVQKLGEQCRYHNRLGLKLSEFIILVVARRLNQPVEWAIHAPIAQKAGVSVDTINALAEGRRPASLDVDEALVHDALHEMWSHDRWSDATWESVTQRFGEDGAIDLVVTAGYYALLANVMNVARTVTPPGPILPKLGR
ncbi:MAG: carboxymuconolactone decarboxylase family protein [Bosea sp. (in: a-proteobacteria)]